MGWPEALLQSLLLLSPFSSERTAVSEAHWGLPSRVLSWAFFCGIDRRPTSSSATAEPTAWERHSQRLPPRTCFGLGGEACWQREPAWVCLPASSYSPRRGGFGPGSPWPSATATTRTISSPPA